MNMNMETRGITKQKQKSEKISASSSAASSSTTSSSTTSLPTPSGTYGDAALLNHIENAVAKAMERERKNFDQYMERREEQFRDIIDQKLSSLHDLEVSIDKFRDLQQCQEKLQLTSGKVDDLSFRLNLQEQYSRRNNIRILGVKDSPNEVTDEKVCEVASSIGIKITPLDIDRSHRIGPRKQLQEPGSSYANAAQKQPKSSPSPIIVKLLSYKTKHLFMINRRKLKGTGVVVVEDLTKQNSDLLFQTSRHSKVSASWTIDGRVFAAVKATNGKETRQLITAIADLKSL